MKIRIGIAMILLASLASASDWPVHGHDAGRSFISPDKLSFPLHASWVHQVAHPPRPAFDDTHSNPGRQPSATYDRAFQVVSAQGRIFFGSSSEDALICLDAETGEEHWRFFCEGAIRLAPALYGDRVYFGSDDGLAYCLNATDGREIWRHNPAPRQRTIIGSGRFMSQWPIRSGVVVRDGLAWFAAGLLPPHGTFLCAVDAQTGRPVHTYDLPWTPEGTLMFSGERIVLPTGITSPLELDPVTGKLFPDMKLDYRRAGGGPFAGSFGDMLVYGPNYNGRLGIRTELTEPPVKHPPRVAGKPAGGITGVMGRRLILNGSSAYLLRTVPQNTKSPVRTALLSLEAEPFMEALKRDGQISYKYGWIQSGESKPLGKALQSHSLWSTPINDADVSMILVGGHLIVGGVNRVAAYNADTGAEVWQERVEGTAWDLAAADGALLVSTDLGKIYRFTSGGESAKQLRTAKNPAALPATDEVTTYASAALTGAKTQKGFCVVIGSGDGSLAAEIARTSDLYVLGLEKNAEQVARSRAALRETGLYGARVVVHYLDGKTLPYLSHFANLIVVQNAETYDIASFERLLRPCGGTLLLPECLAGETGPSGSSLDWQKAGDDKSFLIARKGQLPGAGEWSHIYADPGNGANSGDTRVQGLDFDLQWIGPPGTLRVINRHWTPMGPLYRDGRLFILGHDYLTVVDAYNGTYLWEKEVPAASRIIMSHNAAPMAAGENNLYIVSKETCLALDVQTGETAKELTGPNAESHWGYIGLSEGLLIGSNQKPDATVPVARGSHSKFYRLREKKYYEPGVFEGSNPAVSENLFAIDPASWLRTWSYSSGAILNTTITIADSCIYFVESRNPDMGNTALPAIHAFFEKDAFLVALDLKTGKMLWEKPLISQARHTFYLAYAEGMLLSTATHHDGFQPVFVVRGINPETGEQKWETSIVKKGVGIMPNETNHNNYLIHPAVVNGKLYFNFYPHVDECIVDIATGATETMKPDSVSGGPRRCTPFSASASNVFYRQGPVVTMDTRSGKTAPVTGVSRPSCWISVLPAGGLIMMPEAQSTACRCGYALRTSIVMTPVRSTDK